MSVLPDISKSERLAFELDLRLGPIWKLLESVDFDDLSKRQVMALIRHAYGLGYTHALTEESAGQLLEDCPGFKISGRKR